MVQDRQPGPIGFGDGNVQGPASDVTRRALVAEQRSVSSRAVRLYKSRDRPKRGVGLGAFGVALHDGPRTVWLKHPEISFEFSKINDIRTGICHWYSAVPLCGISGVHDRRRPNGQVTK